MKKHWLVLAGVLFFALITWLVIANTSEINKDIEQSVENNQKNVTESAQAKSLYIVETEGGKKIWELTADKAVYRDKNALLTNVKGKFYNEDNKVLLTFQAPIGNYLQDKHQLSLDKGAFVKHPEQNISIASKTMFWSNKTKDITAEGKVKIIKKGFGTSYGDKTTFTLDFNKISIEGNTYSELNFSG